MIRYLKWVLRCSSRFSHRVVLLVDSKVVLGAIAKGRSSSKPLNAIVRRAAALCFAGGLTLHCVFISTKHNPADWPSRGDASSWPSALRNRTYRKPVRRVCPGCGLRAESHPQHLPRRLRGQQGSKFNCCHGSGGSFAYDFDDDRWRPAVYWIAKHANDIDEAKENPSGAWRHLLESDSD